MTGRVAPLPEIHHTKSHKNSLPPIVQNRLRSLSIDSSGSFKSRNLKKGEPGKKIKEENQEDHLQEFISSNSLPFQLPSLPNPIEISFGQGMSELNHIKLKKMNRIVFPSTSRKLLLPDEAERPVIYQSDSSFTKLASPYVQLIKEKGVLSMGMVDPLSSIPKLQVQILIFNPKDNPIFIPLSRLLIDNPVNRSSLQEKFPLLNISQLSTLLLYLARIGDTTSVRYLCRTALININIVDDSGRSPLVYAAIGGHTDTMKILLQSGAIVDALDHGGRTALFHAAYFSIPDSIKILLHYGADITHRDFYGKTVLHYSVFSDNVRSTKLLLSALRRIRVLSWFTAHKWERLIESCDESGLTPMMLAAYLGQLGHLKAMMFLNFSSCKVKDQNGLSCIHFCANNSHLRVSKFLLKKDKTFVYEASQSGCRPIHLAARKGNYALLELLLKIDKKIVNAVDVKKRTPLHYASAYGNVASIRILIEHGADVNFKDDDGVTSLHYATMSNYLDCVQMLVKGGAIVEIDDNSGRSALIWAFMQGHLDIAKVLMPLITKQNYICDSSKNTPLHITSLIGHLNACTYLLQNGAEIDSKNEQGMTPLFQSIIMGWIDITKELIEYGANVSEQDNYGRTPLHWAIISTSNDSIQILLDNPECMIAIPDYHGKEPIHEAANMGNDDLLKILIHLGCDPSCTDDYGFTPLHLSCARGHIVCCKILMESGVPFNALDFSENRKTPLDLAYVEQRQECIQLLREAGCLIGSEIRNLAARAIQFAWSNFKSTKMNSKSPPFRYVQVRENKIMNKAATKIQAWIRGKIQRRKYLRKLKIIQLEIQQSKEIQTALEALDQAKKNRVAAEIELQNTAKDLLNAEEARKKAFYDASSIRKKTTPNKIKRIHVRNTLINNTAALIIQQRWRKYKDKRKSNAQKCKKYDSEKILVLESILDNEKNISTTQEFMSEGNYGREGVGLYRQNTGSKLNTLPKAALHSTPHSPVHQNFESGYFNKVFKSTVAINGREREPSLLKQDPIKRSDSPGLQPPNRGDRTIGKSMEFGEKMIANRGKRLSFDQGDSFKYQNPTEIKSPTLVDSTTTSILIDPTSQSTKRNREHLQRSASSVSSSTQNLGLLFMDSIPKGYDELNFHSILRGSSNKKI